MSQDTSPSAAEVKPPEVEDLRARQKTTADVLTRSQDMEELADGYRFRYPRTRAWSERLEAFSRSWSKSCPHMRFEVGAGENGPLQLKIRGPEGTKQFVESARYMLNSHINPKPSLRNKARQGWRRLTSPLRVLPDFLIIGAKKCGTTALYSYLTQHSSIEPAFQKEIYFFNARFERGPLWYRAFFPPFWQRWARSGPLLTGEATPDYLFHTHTAARVRSMIPQARLIAILRNPVDRAYSFYNHNLRAGLETLSFSEALDQEETRIAGEREKILSNERHFSFSYEHHTYLTRGVYVDQLREWRKHFPESQLQVLATEDLYERPQETLGAALEFLGLPYQEPKGFKKLNAVPYPDMEPGIRDRLQEYFRPHNRRLFEYLGRELGW